MHELKSTNHDGSSDALEANLRALPQPAVPPDLERRLLAMIPMVATTPTRNWPIAEVVSLAIAACLVVAVAYSLALHGRDRHRIANLKPAENDNQFQSPRVDISNRFVSRPAADFPDSLGPPRFVWPLAGIAPPTLSCPSHAFSFD